MKVILYKAYLFVCIVMYSIHSMAMELDFHFNAQPAVIIVNETEQKAIQINNHFFSKSDFFKNFGLFV
ncbi:MAG TPA: hypothetical protein VL201_02715, partial [Patescibacteria group bacterium]|nr:hypothetical protein [Patescibacteria group bacterium]